MSLSITRTIESCELDSGYDTYIIDATDNNIILTLPTAASDGTYFWIKRIDTNVGHSVSIVPSESQMIHTQLGEVNSLNLPISTSVYLSSFDDGAGMDYYLL